VPHSRPARTLVLIFMVGSVDYMGTEPQSRPARTLVLIFMVGSSSYAGTVPQSRPARTLVLIFMVVPRASTAGRIHGRRGLWS